MPLQLFHSSVSEWFTRQLGAPTPPQREGWPLIAAGKHTIISAPTGSGKTLSAFLIGIDRLLKQGADLSDTTQLLYISPLKALGNDIQKNLERPLAELYELDPSLPRLRVLVRTGDTPAKERARMKRVAPHILVTTPESLYLLLTGTAGRAMLKNVKTVIVDELHAIARDKRGSHLTLSLERLAALAGDFQRIGLSATQRPMERMLHFLIGEGRAGEIVNIGHRREMDLGVCVPPSPLTAVCSHEQWDEIYQILAELIETHRTTIIFVNTRKLAERLSARLGEKIGSERVACHHGSMARDRRLAAEQQLKDGQLRALVATASLELGIDIGDVDLAVQMASVRSIATFLQRMGRAGHGVHRIPKGRLFPLTLDDLAESAALLRSVSTGSLDNITIPEKPLDILMQQIVAECAGAAWDERELFDAFRRAYPYRLLTIEEFDASVALHTKGRDALLHRDELTHTLRATKRAKLRAVTSGGAIGDKGEYSVILEPEGLPVGSVDEDFAVESSRGDIFQLGTASWKVIKVEPGKVHVSDAKGAPPTIPFWIGEAPARTVELAAEISNVREECGRRKESESKDWLLHECKFSEIAAEQLSSFIEKGKQALGAVPTQKCIIAERFFDETGGQQLVIHSPFGGRINRAIGYSIRKRICRSFGFELQAAANEDAIVLSLGPQTSFPLEEIFSYIPKRNVREILTQAILPAPMANTRWRWNVTRGLLIDKIRGGKRTPIAIQRMLANDLLVKAFPQIMACGETLPPGDIPVPLDHPLVRQTIHDCLTEPLDIDGFLQFIDKLTKGEIQTKAVETTAPSPFADGILSAGVFAFLDDAPLEERRTQAVGQRRNSSIASAGDFGELDEAAIDAVRDQAWPKPASVEEVHEMLCWIGYITEKEARPWASNVELLLQAGRAVLDGGRIFAFGANRDEKELLRGRLLALGPVPLGNPEFVHLQGAIAELELEGFLLRYKHRGVPTICERGLLSRIHHYTLEKLRRDIAPVTPAEFCIFLDHWLHRAESARLEGPRGLQDVIHQLSGFEASAIRFDRMIFPSRLITYKREWLDQLTLSGEVSWARLWGSGAAAPRIAPISLFPREHLDLWCSLAPPPELSTLSTSAAIVYDVLNTRGALFSADLMKQTKLLPTPLEAGVAELISRGLLTTDSFAALRFFFAPPAKRRRGFESLGRISLITKTGSIDATTSDAFVANVLLKRTGVVFRATAARERIPVPWYRLLRVLRTLEARGEIRGGRFVTTFSGEQYAHPDALAKLRQLRREGSLESKHAISHANDPLSGELILQQTLGAPLLLASEPKRDANPRNGYYQSRDREREHRAR
ncbi:MAG: DEAD/DEAH box helicase [Planctomycetota bacterium]